MQYTVNRGEKGKIEIKVDIPKATFVVAYGDVLESLGKDAKIAGFRPGNIPKDVLESNVGLNKILNETASFLVSRHLSDIFKKEEIIPLGNPNIAVHSLAKDSLFSFTATMLSKPKVKIGDWKKIKVKKVTAKEVEEKDVYESIKNIYEAWKEQKSVKGTEGSEGSEGTEDEQKGKKFIYDAHGNRVFFDDKKTLRSSSSQDSTAGLKVDLKDGAEVTEGTKGSKGADGEINDQFAKAIGAQDLKHLQELVRADLEKIMADSVEEKLEQELFDEILKLTDVEVPDILVDDELNRIIVRITQNLEAQNRKLEDYLKEQNTTLDALKAKLRPQAEKNVKVTLVMDEIGQSEKVQVTAEEIETATKGVDKTKLDEKQKQDLRNYLAISIFQAKTLDLVKKAVAGSPLSKTT